MKARMQERGAGARNEMNEKNGTVRKTAGAERKKGGVLRRMLTVLLAICPVVCASIWIVKTLKRLIVQAKDKAVTTIEEKIEQKKEETYVRTGI